MSIESPLKRLGQIYGRIDLKAYNRTGAAVTKGMVLMADINGTQSETSATPGASGSTEGDVAGPLANWIKPATTNLQCWPMAVVLDTTAADDAIVNLRMYGLVEVAVGDDDVIDAGAGDATDVDRGDPITVINAVTYVGRATTTLRCVGFALEAAAASSATTARTVDTNSHLRWCMFNGKGAGDGFAL